MGVCLIQDEKHLITNLTHQHIASAVSYYLNKNSNKCEYAYHTCPPHSVKDKRIKLTKRKLCVCVCVCASHPLLPALQRSADVLQVVHVFQQLEAPLPHLAFLLLLAAPRLLPQAAHHPAQVGQRRAPVGGTLLILFHLREQREGVSVKRFRFQIRFRKWSVFQIHMLAINKIQVVRR